MTTKIWNGGSDNWATPGDWNPSGVPGSGDAVDITSGDPEITGNDGTVASVVDSASLNLSDGSLTVSGTFDVAGDLFLDASSNTGGSTLTVDGQLTNSGLVDIGPGDNSLTTADLLSVASIVNFVDTNFGTINVDGGISNGSVLAELDVAGAAGFGAAGYLVGAINLSGDALIEFGSGSITTIDASSELTLNGNEAFLADEGDLTTNGALTGLSTVEGALYLDNGAFVTVDGSLEVSGAVVLDQGDEDGGAGLTIVDALSNSGLVQIGSSNNTLTSPDTVTVDFVSNDIGTVNGSIELYGGQGILSELDVLTPAGFGQSGTVVGAVNLSGDALIEFSGGAITAIAANSELTLDGASAFVADASDTTENSALTDLETVQGSFYLDGGASLATNDPLANSGSILVDQPTGDGGSSLNIGGESDQQRISAYRPERQHAIGRRHGASRRRRQRERRDRRFRKRRRSHLGRVRDFGRRRLRPREHARGNRRSLRRRDDPIRQRINHDHRGRQRADPRRGERLHRRCVAHHREQRSRRARIDRGVARSE